MRVERYINYPVSETAIRTGKDGQIVSYVNTDTITHEISIVGKYEELEDLLFNSTINDDGFFINVFNQNILVDNLYMYKLDGVIFQLDVVGYTNTSYSELVGRSGKWYRLEDIVADFTSANSTGFLENIAFRYQTNSAKFFVDTPADTIQLYVVQIGSFIATIDVITDSIDGMTAELFNKSFYVASSGRTYIAIEKKKEQFVNDTYKISFTLLGGA